MLVYILLIYMAQPGYTGGPVLIDNIRSREDCRALALKIKAAFPDRYERGVCIPVDRSPK